MSRNAFAAFACLVVAMGILTVMVESQRRRIKELEHKAAMGEANDDVYWRIVDKFYRLEAHFPEYRREPVSETKETP